jgi:hypothetical protein
MDCSSWIRPLKKILYYFSDDIIHFSTYYTSKPLKICNGALQSWDSFFLPEITIQRIYCKHYKTNAALQTCHDYHVKVKQISTKTLLMLCRCWRLLQCSRNAECIRECLWSDHNQRLEGPTQAKSKSFMRGAVSQTLFNCALHICTYNSHIPKDIKQCIRCWCFPTQSLVIARF